MHGRPSIAGFLRENEDEELIQRVMSQEHVSIQVARNLLKAGRLGVGPGAKYVGKDSGGDPGGGPPEAGGGTPTGSLRDFRQAPGAPPPKFDKKKAALAMEEKLRKMQEDKEDEEESQFQNAKKAQMQKKRIGIGRLGPVSTREEEVDPLKIKIAAIEARREIEAEDRDDQEVEWKLPHEMQPQAPTQEELRKLNKEQRKRKNQKDDDSEESGDERTWKDKRARADAPDANRAGSSSGSNLMSEAEVQASMKRDKKRQVQRGSAGAAARIQREMAEWEQSKAKNPEFWKPPKFCLVLGSGRR